jgi:3-methyladenine DNA glycosylase AlkD
LLGYLPAVRKKVSMKQLDSWLDQLVGWAEVDALCQNIFQPEELLENWSVWSTFLSKLSKSNNIQKRRASLVLLTGPTWKSGDQRLHKHAYAIIDHLKHEPDILITKAISWLLRSMADTCPNEVSQYLKQNFDSLPKIAVRETKKKLETGKKN